MSFFFSTINYDYTIRDDVNLVQFLLHSKLPIDISEVFYNIFWSTQIDSIAKSRTFTLILVET